MYYTFLSVKDFIKKNIFKFMGLLLVVVVSIGVGTIIVDSSTNVGVNGKEDGQKSSSSVGGSTKAEDSVLPTSLSDVYNLLTKEVKKYKGLKVFDGSENILIEDSSGDETKKLYVEYSSRYDCTVLKEDVSEDSDIEPVRIFYHFEYENGKTMANDLLSEVKAHNNSDKPYDVSLTPNDDGTVNIKVE